MDRRIRNFDALASTPPRKDALAIAEAGYEAIDVGAAFARTVRLEGDELIVAGTAHPVSGRRIFFVGVGKCAIAGAEAAERVLGARLAGGIALDVRGLADGRLKRIDAFVGTHPKPTQENVDATHRILSLLEQLEERDLVILLVSGGGSVLLCSPEEPFTCTDEGVLFDALTDKGATIEELNTVRKHLSKARGGWLAKAALPAEVIALIVSDVPGNDPEFIASGPTVKDTTSVADAEAVLAKYGVPLPPGGFIETPKDEADFARTTNVLFLSNKDALAAMAAEASARGYAARVVTDTLRGEARAVASQIVEELHGAPPKTALLYAGETTVTLGDHPGRGGRNQELALATLGNVRDGELVLPFSSDGRDATDHAGAIADSETRAHARARNADAAAALTAHSSYDFFEATGDALLTGLLESNVSDLIIAIKS